MEFDFVFTTPEVEASEIQALKKRKRDKHLEVFEILKDAAHERIRAMEEDIYGEVESRFENHRRRLGDIDVDRLLRAGTAGPSATTPTSHRICNFKPNEAFLGLKPLVKDFRYCGEGRGH